MPERMHMTPDFLPVGTEKILAAAVGGVENSYHVQGLAADIRPENLEDLPELQDLCLELNSDGGVGLYDSFVHVDARGFKARWDNCKK